MPSARQRNFILVIFFFGCSLNSFSQTTPKDWYNKGDAFKKEKKIQEAVNAYNKAAAAGTGYYEASYMSGWCYNELGKYDSAILSLNKTIRVKPDHANAYFELGYANKKKKQLGEAEKMFNKAILFNPNYYNAYKEVADVYAQLSRKEEALATYQKWSEKEPGSADARHWAGYTCNGMEKYDQALDWLQKANAIKPSALTYNEIGFAYYKQKKNEESIAAYQKALELEPGNGTAYKGIGDVYRRNFKPVKTAEALENYRKAIVNNPKSAGSYYGIGWCHNNNGNYQEAIAILKKALEIEPTMSAAYAELGYSQYMTAAYTDAIQTLNNGISYDSKSSLCRYYLGLVYVAQKDKANAQKIQNELVGLDKALSDKLLEKINALQ